MLLVVWGAFSTSSLGGEAIVKNKIAAARHRPVGLFIAAGAGRKGPRTTASINGVVIAFEAPIEDVDIADGDDATVDGDEEMVEDRPPHRAPRLRIANGTVEELTFGVRSDMSNAAVVSNVLEILLRDELEAVNTTCKLTQAQQKKLALAGRGDIKRFIDRAASLRACFEKTDDILDDDQFRAWVTPLGRECERLGQLVNSGFFGADSLFFKTLRTTLTPEQRAQLNAAETPVSNPTAVPRRQMPQ